ncbi:MAG: cytochrome c biogenesis protein CcsA [Acidobacteriota bacterium]
MKAVLPWLLWVWISITILAAFFYAPLAAGFIGESSRILFFHVPMAWTSFVAFLAAGVWSARYLWGGREPRHDRSARVAVELGLLFAVLATATGAIWARIMWGAYWNWDPRQISICMALLFYGAYLALRESVDDEDTRARLAAAYAVLGLVVAPFLYFVVPRITFSLHPDSVVNARGKVDMESHMLQVLLLGSLGFNVFFFWLHNLQVRISALTERRQRKTED